MEIHFADVSALSSLLSQGESEQGWQVQQVDVTRRRATGNEAGLSLELSLDLLLAVRTPGKEIPLTLQLKSDCWAFGEPWPPRQAVTACTPAVPGTPSAALAYRISGIERRLMPRSDEGFWQRYLSPQAPTEEPGVALAVRPVAEVVQEAVAEYLEGTLAVGTVAGAQRFLEHGPAGVFGPVSPHELERTGQPDLQLDATRLAEADDGEEQGGEPTLLLALYGDRHGAWVLHRRRLQPRKGRRNEPAPPPLYQSDVLVADTAAELVQLAGLGRTEKALFARAGVLPTDDLRTYYLPDPPDADVPAKTPPVDLASFDARTRRYLDALLILVRDRRLATQDLDALLRVARQMARSK